MRKITIEVDGSTSAHEGRIAVDYGQGGSDLESRMVLKIKPAIETALKVVLGSSVLGEYRGKDLDEAKTNAEAARIVSQRKGIPTQ